MFKHLRLTPDYNFLRPAYWFGQVDSRPLSLFRIVFALILLKDAIYYLHLIPIFYTDSGLLPRDVVWRTSRSTRFSLLDALPSDWMVTLFFLAWIAVLLALLVGYRTRWMAILNFVMILSVHERNLLVLNGADTVFRVLSFWMIFLPLGDYYAVDAILRRWQRYTRSRQLADLRVEAQPQTVFALYLRLTQLQFALIYLFAFIMKLPGKVWEEGDALHYTLQLQSIVLPTGDWMLRHAPTDLLKFMTVFTLATEGAFFFLVFAPIFQPYLRVIGLLAGLLLHGGIGVLMAISNFSNVMLTGYLLFFQPGWVLWLDHRLRLPRQPVQLPLPSPGSPLWLLLAVTRSDEIDVTDPLALPDAPIDHALPLYAHLPLSRLWARFSLCRRLIFALAALIMRFIQPPMPDAPTVTLPPRPLTSWRWAGRFAIAALLLPMMVAVWWSNLALIQNAEQQPIIRRPNATLFSAMQTLGLWQSWDMFAPRPIIVDGWFIAPGVFEDGTSVDLRTGQPVSHELPRIFYGMDGRWREFQMHLWLRPDSDVLGAWGSYYCRLYNVEQNRPYGQRLASLQLRWRYRYSHDPNQPAQEWQETMLWTHWCFDQYRQTIANDVQQLCAPFCPPAATPTQEEVAMPPAP